MSHVPGSGARPGDNHAVALDDDRRESVTLFDQACGDLVWRAMPGLERRHAVIDPVVVDACNRGSIGRRRQPHADPGGHSGNYQTVRANRTLPASPKIYDTVIVL